MLTLTPLSESSLCCVCFRGQDPGTLEAHHDRQVYEELCAAWQQVQLEYPGMVSGDPPGTQLEFTEMATSTSERGSGSLASASDGVARGVGQV